MEETRPTGQTRAMGVVETDPRAGVVDGAGAGRTEGTTCSWLWAAGAGGGSCGVGRREECTRLGQA